MAAETTTKPIWKPVALAFGVAAVLLLTIVLPAEYGKDPTGIGSALGLTGLADLPPSALAAQEQGFRKDTVSFTLAPFESLEYKYTLDEGAGLVFSWISTNDLEFDFHSEPEGADEGLATSFDIGVGAARSGTYVAQFAGEHGWFWENRDARDVTVTLEASGFITDAVEYRDGFANMREIEAGQN